MVRQRPRKRPRKTRRGRRSSSENFYTAVWNVNGAGSHAVVGDLGKPRRPRQHPKNSNEPIFLRKLSRWHRPTTSCAPPAAPAVAHFPALRVGAQHAPRAASRRTRAAKSLTLARAGWLHAF
jgi:hypothetical protein